jgi:hypothetical protein
MKTRDDSIPDLTAWAYHHVPELAFRRDLPSPLAAIAVGWLGSNVPTSGSVPESLIAMLRTASNEYSTDTGELGYHTCAICNRFEDRGEFIIETEGRTYVLPRMILHYIEKHRYRPPQQFLDDLSKWNDRLNKASGKRRGVRS